METSQEISYVKRTQKDYNSSFKLQVDREIESGELTIKEFLLEEYKVERKAMEQLAKQNIRSYDQLRPHLSCSFRTPIQMHSQQKKIKMKTYKKNLSSKG